MRGQPMERTMPLTELDALRIAREIADKNGWPWEDPVKAWRSSEGIFRKRYRWTVRTNANAIGRNVWIGIDDATGEVLSAGFGRR
jgi:hypothetical protein